MGIYIKGMEMPPEGTAEAIVIHSDGAVGFLHEDDFRKLTAVPVLPHGRLIDADALINALQKLFNRRKIDAEYMGFRGAFVNWNDAIYYIKDASTIIPAEEVYAHGYDTAGNFHWVGTHSGEHTVKAEEET